jgi:hypothetical protein
MPTAPAGVRLADKKELANHIKAKIAEFDKAALDDKDFRQKVLDYFKPGVPVQW